MAVNTLTLYMPGSSVGIQVYEGSQLHLLYVSMGANSVPSAPGETVRKDPFPQYIDVDELAAALAGIGGGASDAAVAALVANSGSATAGALSAAFVPLAQLALNPDLLIVGTITRDANGAATSAPVEWPDGTPGTYTATTVSTAFPGAVDAYAITYGSPVTKTYTQPAVTRDPSGAVTQRPALVES